MTIPSTYEAASHVELTIRRPNGDIEVVRPRVPGQQDRYMTRMTEREFELFRRHTREAGRGEILSYANVTKTVTIDPATLAEMQAASDAEERYNKSTRAVYAAMDAYREGHRDGSDNDNTPSHKTDY